jgi:hypothetical protein
VLNVFAGFAPTRGFDNTSTEPPLPDMKAAPVRVPPPERSSMAPFAPERLKDVTAIPSGTPWKDPPRLKAGAAEAIPETREVEVTDVPLTVYVTPSVVPP